MELGTTGIEGLEEFEDEQGLFSYIMFLHQLLLTPSSIRILENSCYTLLLVWYL